MCSSRIGQKKQQNCFENNNELAQFLSGMKLPIIVNNRGDVMFFTSVDEVEQELEAVDVERSEYVAYDSEGRLVQLGTALRKQLLFFNVKRVVVQNAEPSPTHAGELQEVLRKFFRHLRVGEPEEWIASASLDNLVSRGLKKYKH